MMRGFATFYGKHRIIATNGSNIIFAKQMHHIAAGDASFISNVSPHACIGHEAVETFKDL